MKKNVFPLISIIQDAQGFQSLEDACLRMARNILVAILQALDDYLLEIKPKRYRVEDIKTRTLVTRVGVIVIKRRMYKKATQKKGEGKPLYLLDEVLNLPPRRQLVGSMLKLGVSLCTRLSFREAAEVLEEAGFGSISHQTLHNAARAYGEAQIQLISQMRKGLFLHGEEPEGEKRKVKILFIEADGIYVKAQGTTKRTQEIKMAAVHEGWCEKGGRRELKNLRIFLGCQDDEPFWEAFSAHLTQYYDIDEDTVIVVNGDGASWIQKTVKQYFPKAIVQLDRFHLYRDIRKLYGPEVAKEMIEHLERGETKVVIDTLDSLEARGGNKDVRRKRATFVNFLREHEEHLVDYRLRLPDHIDREGLHGMGAAETLVDKKVGNRMKKRGMRWSEKGCRAMAALLMLRSNGQLFTWIDKAFTETPLNPIRKLQQIVREHPRTSDWLNKIVAPFKYSSSSKPWVKVLREICDGAFSFC